MTIDFKPLMEIPKDEVITLLNHPLVRKHMPLAKDEVDDKGYQSFIHAKQELWRLHGYGPWALVVESKFIGWGGLQYEAGDADIALVLHPDYWGMGKKIYEMIIKKAFKEMKLESITALLPPTRKQSLIRLGFKPDGELEIEGERFIRYRLHRPIN